MKYYTIYRITNTMNGKTYIGKHVTEKVDDDYMGSGKHLTRAIAKYGAENFAKTILHVYSTEAEMNARERELVTEAWCLRDDTYNLCVGGQGGWSYINREALGKGFKVTRHDSTRQELFANASVKGGRITAEKYRTDLEYRNLHKEKCQGNLVKDGSIWLGRKHTIETRKKMSGERLQSSGSNNSQSGTQWITNGTENKKIPKSAVLPNGWVAGRNMVQ